MFFFIKCSFSFDTDWMKFSDDLTVLLAGHLLNSVFALWVCVCVLLVVVQFSCLTMSVSRATLIFGVLAPTLHHITGWKTCRYRLLFSCFSSHLRLHFFAICTDKSPPPPTLFETVVKPHANVRLKFQPSKCQGGPLAVCGFCLLYVEVSFCCMRRSAVSLGCSEPGWERWREGTAPKY